MNSRPCATSRPARHLRDSAVAGVCLTIVVMTSGLCIAWLFPSGIALPARQALTRLGSGAALVAAGLACGATAAQEPPAPPRLIPSDDGNLVVDQRSKIAWARCVEGTEWNGKYCKGLPLLFDRAEALEAAKARSKAEGIAWRLPRANELRHLVNRRAIPPGVDTTLFPGAPGTWHWSSTSRIVTSSINAYNYGSAMRGSTGGTSSQMGFRQGWAVDMASGEASDVDKNSRLPVRLVRPWPDTAPAQAGLKGTE